MRIGLGIDAHIFTPVGEADSFVLGGVEIPYDRGVIAHSDGDVLLHALMDAILGALGLEDIGHQFPDSDPKYQNADSKEMTRGVVAMMQRKGYSLVNVDATLLLEAPKMKPHRQAMIASVAEVLACKTSQVSIKATTVEKMGAIGRGEGLAAQVVVLLQAI